MTNKLERATLGSALRRAERALGQIEGAALGQPEMLRELLMTAAEELDGAIRVMRSQIALLQLSADEEELPADTSPSGLRPATSPQGEALSAKEGCNNCRDHVRLCSWNGVETYIEGRKLITTKDEWKYEADIRFCPVCGRKL